MKDDDRDPNGSLIWMEGLRRILHGPLVNPDRVVFVTESRSSQPLRHWFHTHDQWELLCPLNRPLRYEIAGEPPASLDADEMLILAPGCVHMASARLPQAADLCAVNVRLAGDDKGLSSLYVGSLEHVVSSALSREEAEELTNLVDEAPHRLLQRAALAMTQGAWNRERAVGLLRVVIAGYAQVIAGRARPEGMPAERRAMDALAYLQARYYDRELDVAEVARAVGVSSSHLTTLFRDAIGDSVHQALIKIRLRRAIALLQTTDYTIKEIAVLTGWSSPFHLSATVQRHYGSAPSALRHSART